MFYLHGPLKRTELGELKVQGLDYAYTLHGWIKSVNSGTLESYHDMGKDGNEAPWNPSVPNPHQFVARDVMGYYLSYFEEDYQAVSNLPATPNIQNFSFNGQYRNLYNGNIAHMGTALANANSYWAKTYQHQTLGNVYRYDQLNRITKHYVFDHLVAPANDWPGATNQGDQQHHETFAYDANGNILNLLRHGHLPAPNMQMDDLAYQYQYDNHSKLVAGQTINWNTPHSNKLYHVNDNANSSSYSEDVDDQGAFNSNPNTMNTANNYGYDELGNLVRDNAEEIDNIEWTVQGKIKKITRTIGSSKPMLEFGYDATGQRLWKKVTPANGGPVKISYYLCDAQGNTMANYQQTTNDIGELMLTASEHPIYGSSRVGVDSRIDTLFKNGPYTPDWQNDLVFESVLGLKSYELSNHLGNVLATISDRKIAQDPDNDLFANYYTACVITTTDYYAFGSAMSTRAIGGYRYSFNGKETDTETGLQDYGFRIYNPSLGKFLSVDPLAPDYPELTTYQFASNTPIWAVDLDGLEARVYTDLTTFGAPHSFISVIDDEGVIHVYTFGQYGQEGTGLGGLYNTGSALVHLVGEDANRYINYEFEHYPMSVFEISSLYVDKQKIIDYFSEEMKKYSIPAQKIYPHAPYFVNEENGSSAVNYKFYAVTPTGDMCGDNENCTSVVMDALKVGGFNTLFVPAIPQALHESLWESANMWYDKNIVKVTDEEKKAAENNHIILEICLK